MAKDAVPQQKWSPVISPAVAAVLIAAVVVFIIRISLPSLGPSPGFVMNEMKAAAALRTIGSAQHLYFARHKTFATLDQLLAVHSIDVQFAKATTPENAMNGYYFRIEPGKDEWSGVALPAQPGVTGRRSFYVDHMAVIRHAKCESADDPPAGPGSPELD